MNIAGRKLFRMVTYAERNIIGLKKLLFISVPFNIDLIVFGMYKNYF